MVGIGPGGREHLTYAAECALRSAEVVVGYSTYLEQIEPILQGKPVIAGAMREEEQRAAEAIQLAQYGHQVVVVSGGDPGIYGMAGLVLEMLPRVAPGVEVKVVPGVTAASAAAASLGAPLMNDFAVISLSDLLTPLEVIEQRVRGALAGNYVIVLYNPRSQTRVEPLERALDLIRSARPASTPVGVVRNASRPGESVQVTTLGALKIGELDMRCVVIVGNSDTEVIQGRMVTRRGYGSR